MLIMKNQRFKYWIKINISLNICKRDRNEEAKHKAHLLNLLRPMKVEMPFTHFYTKGGCRSW